MLNKSTSRLPAEITFTTVPATQGQSESCSGFAIKDGARHGSLRTQTIGDDSFFSLFRFLLCVLVLFLFVVFLHQIFELHA